MKKVLLGTTALVSAVLVAQQAQADGQPQGRQDDESGRADRGGDAHRGGEPEADHGVRRDGVGDGRDRRVRDHAQQPRFGSGRSIAAGRSVVVGASDVEASRGNRLAVVAPMCAMDPVAETCGAVNALVATQCGDPRRG